MRNLQYIILVFFFLGKKLFYTIKCIYIIIIFFFLKEEKSSGANLFLYFGSIFLSTTWVLHRWDQYWLVPAV